MSRSARQSGNHPPGKAPPGKPQREAHPASPVMHSLRQVGTPHALPKIRQLVVDACERCGFDGETVAKIEMAVGEACSNIVEHAYRTLPEPLDLEVKVFEHSDRLEIVILDYSSINFPVDQMAGVPLDDYLETQQRRGLGLYIIRNFVDSIEHHFVCGQGNELRLVKFFA